MKLNNKGFTVIEVLTSIVIISIILIFIVNIFISVNSVYIESKLGIEYETLRDNVIDIVSYDIKKYGLSNIRYDNLNGTINENKIIITFDTYKQNKIGENIRKSLEITDNSTNEYKIIKYGYDNPSNEEKKFTLVKRIPDNAIINKINYINENNYIEIKLPLKDKLGNNYDINIYGIIKKGI